MFPNSQDAFPLPQRPNLERYKKLAKELVKACRSKNEGAIREWAEKWVAALIRQSGIHFVRPLSVVTSTWTDRVEQFVQRKVTEQDGRCRLADAQFIIARSHGFESWVKFSKHLSALAQKASTIARFEAAADAIVKGDIKTLQRLLRDDPHLIRARSTREHRATLLHYVSANGVEGYRQKTPKNIVEVAKVLLEAGADVDAVADVYNSSCTTLGLVATSGPPQEAGVQRALLHLLLANGAAMDRPGLAGRTNSLVQACFANGQPDAARFLADHGAPLDLETAAGVGRLELVKSLPPSATQQQLQNGF